MTRQLVQFCVALAQVIIIAVSSGVPLELSIAPTSSSGSWCDFHLFFWNVPWALEGVIRFPTGCHSTGVLFLSLCSHCWPWWWGWSRRRFSEQNREQHYCMGIDKAHDASSDRVSALACNHSGGDCLYCLGPSLPTQREVAHAWHWDFCSVTYGFWEQFYLLMWVNRLNSF